jgi:hypothetical protein
MPSSNPTETLSRAARTLDSVRAGDRSDGGTRDDDEVASRTMFVELIRFSTDS